MTETPAAVTETPAAVTETPAAVTETDSSCPDSSCPRRRLKPSGTRRTVGSTAQLCPTLSGHWHRIRPSSTRYHRNGRTRSLRPMSRLSMSALVRTTQGRRRRGKEEASAALPPRSRRGAAGKRAGGAQAAVMLLSTICASRLGWLDGSRERRVGTAGRKATCVNGRTACTMECTVALGLSPVRYGSNLHCKRATRMRMHAMFHCFCRRARIALVEVAFCCVCA